MQMYRYIRSRRNRSACKRKHMIWSLNALRDVSDKHFRMWCVALTMVKSVFLFLSTIDALSCTSCYQVDGQSVACKEKVCTGEQMSCVSMLYKIPGQCWFRRRFSLIWYSGHSVADWSGCANEQFNAITEGCTCNFETFVFYCKETCYTSMCNNLTNNFVNWVSYKLEV